MQEEKERRGESDAAGKKLVEEKWEGEKGRK